MSKKPPTKTKVYRLDFTGKFVGFDGEPVTDGNGNELADINVYIGNSLSMIRTDDPPRSLAIARKLYSDKLVDLEKHDKDYLFKLLPKLLNLSDLMLEQVQEIFEKAEK